MPASDHEDADHRAVHDRSIRHWAAQANVRKKLSAIGNSLGGVIERPILDLLDIDRETELEMTTDGERLIIEPVRRRQKRVLASAKKVMGAHDSTFRKLE